MPQVFGNRFVGYLTIVGVQPPGQGGILPDGFDDPQIRDFTTESSRCVGEGEGGGSGHGSGHVGDAIMDDAVFEVRGLVMRGRPAGLDATALVDRDIHHDRPRIHLGNQGFRHQLGRLAPSRLESELRQ